MGLIDDIRKKKDSWTSRLEEQRQDDYDETNTFYQDGEKQLSEEEIKRNLEMVGKFEKEHTNKL